MEDKAQNPTLRLNKYLAHCGVCTRREAIDLIKKGFVTVNGETVKDPFFETDHAAQVCYKGKPVRPAEKKEYVLLNKPANIPFGPHPVPGKPNVQALLHKLTTETLTPAFPVGDGDCGLTILTNDGDLAEKLSSYKNRIRMMFEVHLAEKVTPDDITALLSGAKETFQHLSGIEILEEGPPAQLGAELKSGDGVMLRKWLSDAGFTVTKTDLTAFGSLTKKDLKRGWSRKLTDREVIFLKHF